MRQSEVLSLMRENVAYKLQHGRAKEAVDMLEKLHKYVKQSVPRVLRNNVYRLWGRNISISSMVLFIFFVIYV